MNQLDDFENRLSYACSFGAMINAIATIFLNPNILFGQDSTGTSVKSE